jgi:hypothetical protein
LDGSDNQLPATIQQAEVTSDRRALNVVPAIIADLGDEAAWRYVEFFTANVRNPNTRRAYVRACNRIFAWCEDRGLEPAAIRPHDVATYIEELQFEVSAPSVKQQLDWRLWWGVDRAGDVDGAEHPLDPDCRSGHASR